MNILWPFGDDPFPSNLGLGLMECACSRGLIFGSVNRRKSRSGRFSLFRESKMTIKHCYFGYRIKRILIGSRHFSAQTE